jgi:hypothetical protein
MKQTDMMPRDIVHLSPPFLQKDGFSPQAARSAGFFIVRSIMRVLAVISRCLLQPLACANWLAALRPIFVDLHMV